MGEGAERNGGAGPGGGHPFGCAPLPCRPPDHLGRQPGRASSGAAGKDNAATVSVGDGARDEGKLGLSADQRPRGREVETVEGGRASVRGNLDEGDGNPVPPSLVPFPLPRGSRAPTHPHAPPVVDAVPTTASQPLWWPVPSLLSGPDPAGDDSRLATEQSGLTAPDNTT